MRARMELEKNFEDMIKLEEQFAGQKKLFKMQPDGLQKINELDDKVSKVWNESPQRKLLGGTRNQFTMNKQKMGQEENAYFD